ncbi:Oligoendopeptidase F OS=Lysinibacillus sphaericus OX=1421 GN=LS41612_19295 PE=3 SV=1 [Lysinibacillus sphaericus]
MEEEFKKVAELSKEASSYAGTLKNGADALLAVLTYYIKFINVQ